jgi:lipopolysaccharide export system permease protein
MKSNRFIKRLDWYIIKKFLGTYVFAIALIISIAVVFDFNEKMDKLMEHEAPWDKIIFEYYMNFIPYFSNLFSPLFYSLLLFSLPPNWQKTPKLLRCSPPV